VLVGKLFGKGRPGRQGDGRRAAGFEELAPIHGYLVCRETAALQVLRCECQIE
jgi:hypothetical protein